MRRAWVLVPLMVMGCKKDAVSGAPVPPVIVAAVKGECDVVDDTNLKAVAECFYGAKRAASTWRLYSAAAKAESSEAEVAKADRSTFEVTDVRVGKQDTVAGSSFAAVSRTWRSYFADGGSSCSEVATRTWLKEGAAWRFHGGFRTAAELTTKNFQSGDYSGAAQSAEAWLKINPFDVSA